MSFIQLLQSKPPHSQMYIPVNNVKTSNAIPDLMKIVSLNHMFKMLFSLLYSQILGFTSNIYIRFRATASHKPFKRSQNPPGVYVCFLIVLLDIAALLEAETEAFPCTCDKCVSDQ
jgi:hypothetical protein